MFSLLYGQCRSINNAALAEVKEACVSGGSAEGEEEGERDKENKAMGKWRGEDGTKQGQTARESVNAI